jgi:signal transduction histidine kinase
MAVGDPRLMDRILHNLLSNAVKFAPRGGEIRMSVISQGDGAKIEISDDGPGIPQDKQPRIFEKFSQAGREGAPNSSGLGLCFCKHAIEVQGGSISFRSGEGEGTTFTLFLPVAGEVA